MFITAFLYLFAMNSILIVIPICLSAETRGFKAGAEIFSKVRKDNTTSTVGAATIQRHDGFRRVLHGYTLMRNADVNEVVVRIQRIYAKFVLSPYPLASELPGIDDAPPTLGGSTSALYYIRDSILFVKKKGSMTAITGPDVLLSFALSVPSLSTPEPEIAKWELYELAPVAVMQNYVETGVSLLTFSKSIMSPRRFCHSWSNN